MEGIFYRNSEDCLVGWVGRTLRIILCELLCNRQGQMLLGQVVQSLIQSGLERFQRLGIHAASGQPVPVPHHNHILSVYYTSKHLFPSKAISPWTNNMWPKKSLSSFFVNPF